jgi:hypothetical protein
MSYRAHCPSRQRPLDMSRGSCPHDFTAPRYAWENAVFDAASRFRTVRFRIGHAPEGKEWPSCAEAIEYASQYPGTCVYAATDEGVAGRSFLIDREVWDHWIEREKIVRAARSD